MAKPQPVTNADLNPLGNKIPRFTEDEMTEILEWFDENAKPLLEVNEEKLHVITLEKLQAFLALKKYHKRNFMYPGYGEIMKQMEEWKMDKFRLLTKEQFLCYLDKLVIEPDLRHELLLAFKVFDTEKRDFLDLDELEDILLKNGPEPFTVPELIEFFRDVNIKGDGQIYYEYTIESMLKVTPELAKMKVEYLYIDPEEDPSVEKDPEPEPEPEPEPPPPPPPPPAKSGKDKGKKKK